nr:DNA translocase FtsK 4TM domain-containing protein [Chloroflexota bacterium]
MATKRRAPSRASPGPASRRRGAGSRDVAVGRGRTGRAGTGLRVSSQAARALVGLLLLVAGAVTLIALMLPGEGILNQYVSDLLRPAFGQGAWLLPFLLLTAGFFVERAPNAGNGWGITAIGGLIIFTGALGLIHVVWGEGTSDASVRQAGGFLGARLAEALADLVSRPGAFVVLLGIVLAGVVLLFNLTVRGMLRPVTAGGRVVAEAVSGSFRPRTDDAGLASGPAAQRRERSRGGRAASASAEGNG